MDKELQKSLIMVFCVVLGINTVVALIPPTASFTGFLLINSFTYVLSTILIHREDSVSFITDMKRRDDLNPYVERFIDDLDNIHTNTMYGYTLVNYFVVSLVGGVFVNLLKILFLIFGAA